MNEDVLEKLRYPIGKFKPEKDITNDLIQGWISIINDFPARLRSLVSKLNDEQLDTPYRPQGWKIRQVIHHLVDSHMSSFIRFKWTLTEDKPTIKAYYEDRWAQVADHEQAITASLDLLEALHKKWTYLLKRLSQDDLKRTFIHPQSGKEIALERNLALYAWHCNHHYAHIENLMREKGW